MQKVKVKKEEGSEKKLFEEHFKRVGLNRNYGSKHNSDFVLGK